MYVVKKFWSYLFMLLYCIISGKKKHQCYGWYGEIFCRHTLCTPLTGWTMIYLPIRRMCHLVLCTVCKMMSDIVERVHTRRPKNNPNLTPASSAPQASLHTTQSRHTLTDQRVIKYFVPAFPCACTSITEGFCCGGFPRHQVLLLFDETVSNKAQVQISVLWQTKIIVSVQCMDRLFWF